MKKYKNTMVITFECVIPETPEECGGERAKHGYKIDAEDMFGKEAMEQVNEFFHDMIKRGSLLTEDDEETMSINPVLELVNAIDEGRLSGTALLTLASNGLGEKIVEYLDLLHGSPEMQLLKMLKEMKGGRSWLERYKR